MFDDLNDDNFLIYAMKAYDKTNCILSEFEEDLQRLKYIKRLFRKYRSSGDLKERLVLNHIIILTNVFGIEPSVRMLFFKLDPKDYPLLKTFLLFLNFMPNTVNGINGHNFSSRDITVDLNIGRKLRDI